MSDDPIGSASPLRAETSAPELAFAPILLHLRRRVPPVVVVGLPRSGTKFLTHVLNGLPGLYVFDDLYYFRQVRGIGARSPLSPEHFDQLIGWLAARSVFPDREYQFKHEPVSETDVARIRGAVAQAFQGRAVAVPELLEEWMVRYAAIHRCDHWGYKAPQDFMYLDYVANSFPGTRFVFLYRDPRKVMASYKYVPDRHGRAQRYHPVTYALYWRLAWRTMAAHMGKLPIHRVRFEDLVANPDRVGSELAAFLDLPWLGASTPERVNTSFGAGGRREITPTERWICHRLAGPEMEQGGYALDGAALRVRDVPDLLQTTLRFGYHFASSFLTDPRNRASALTFLNRMRGRSPR
jgi:hypothetical protein